MSNMCLYLMVVGFSYILLFLLPRRLNLFHGGPPKVLSGSSLLFGFLYVEANADFMSSPWTPVHPAC